MRNRTLLAIGIIAFAAIAPISLAFAEGPGTGGRSIRLDNEPAGPYLLRIVTSPTPPRVGSLFVEIRVIDAATSAIVRNAIVLAFAIPTEGDAPTVEAVATHDFAPIPGEYAAHLAVTEPGFWEIRIAVDGAQGIGEVAFIQRISGASSLGAALSIMLPIAGLAALAMGFLWLQKTQGGKASDDEIKA